MKNYYQCEKRKKCKFGEICKEAYDKGRELVIKFDKGIPQVGLSSLKKDLANRVKHNDITN